MFHELDMALPNLVQTWTVKEGLFSHGLLSLGPSNLWQKSWSAAFFRKRWQAFDGTVDDALGPALLPPQVVYGKDHQ